MNAHTRTPRRLTRRIPLLTLIALGTIAPLGASALAATPMDADPRGIVEIDLAITKDDGVMDVLRGQVLTYTIVVSNIGGSRVIGASVTDSFPAELTDVSYTSVAAGGATGNTAAGADASPAPVCRVKITSPTGTV